MAKTEIESEQILNDDIRREDLNVTTVGNAVITKIIAGTGVSITQTGADDGTGDVTINAASGNIDYGGFSANYVYNPPQCIGGDTA